jgi:predicted ABC-type ATPase
LPDLIIVAGPNGAGKTSFAYEYIRAARPDLIFVNADEIAQRLPKGPIAVGQRDRHAARLMLDQMANLLAERKSFMFETTLASLTYARKIPQWREQGYNVALAYLRLPTVDVSLKRIAKRVAAGGHGVAEDVVRRRFAKSIEYLETIYKSIVDEWHIWDSLEHQFKLVQSRRNEWAR